MTRADRLLAIIALCPLTAWLFLGEGFKVASALPSPGQILLFILGLVLVLERRRLRDSMTLPSLRVWTSAVLLAAALPLLRGEALWGIYQDAIAPLAFLLAFAAIWSLPSESQRGVILVAMVACSLTVLKSVLIWFHSQDGVSWSTNWQAFADLGEFRGRVVLRGGGAGILASTAFWIAYLAPETGRRSEEAKLAYVGLALSLGGLILKNTRSDALGLVAVVGLVAARRFFVRSPGSARSGRKRGLWILLSLALLTTFILFGLSAGRATRSIASSFRLNEARTIAQERLTDMVLGESFGVRSSGVISAASTVYSHNYLIFLLLKWGIAGMLAFHVFLVDRFWRRWDDPLAFATVAVPIAALAQGLLANQLATPTMPFLIGVMAAYRPSPRDGP